MQEQPILNRIGCVFVPVSNMERAIGFYNRLLNTSLQDTSHEGRIYTIPMEGDVCLILDGNREVTNSSQPLFFFWSNDIEAARRHLVDSGVESTSEVMDAGSMKTLSFADPDGNLLMVAERKRGAA